MDRFSQMEVFMTVADEGGFSSAARRLGLSAPAITRAISSLERNLGVQLFKRTTRHVRITEAGARYLDDVRRILGEITAADEAVTGINAAPRGHLVVTAPVLFGRLHVMPGIADYLKEYPDMTVDALFLDRVVDMLGEGVDVGVRIGQLPDSGIRARKVGEIRSVLVASPDYLNRSGIPRSPNDLTKHTLVAARAGDFSPSWKFTVENKDFTLKIRPRLTVTSNDSAIEAAIEGLGITRVLSYQVASDLADARLNLVLDEWEQPPLPIHIVHRENLNVPVKVRAFINLLSEQLKGNATLNPRAA